VVGGTVVVVGATVVVVTTAFGIVVDVDLATEAGVPDPQAASPHAINTAAAIARFFTIWPFPDWPVCAGGGVAALELGRLLRCSLAPPSHRWALPDSNR
jgi:hypothetical protein